MVAGFSTGKYSGTALVAPTERSPALCTIKSIFLNLIHQADVTVNGKSVESTQPFINIARHFQLISEISVNDLATLGHSIGFAPTLDNPKAAKHPTTISANQYKVGRYVDITNTTGSGVYGASGLITGAQLNSEFRPIIK
jgi:hypothetical protein